MVAQKSRRSLELAVRDEGDMLLASRRRRAD